MTWIIIIAHFLLDFTFQTTNIANKKRTSFKYLGIHCIVYFIGMTSVCLLLIRPVKALETTAILSGVHFLIDWIRQRVELKFENKHVKFFAFIIDQILHITSIVSICCLLVVFESANSLYLNVCQYEKFKSIVLCAFLLERGAL